ncbi:MAG: 2-C-methyl-D-erythritol 2,4-cyclodiphosphate synthase [Actinomycetota bacterium]
MIPGATEFRVGLGVDAHPIILRPPVVIGGVVVDKTRGVEATSDGDVGAHAVADALLGAAGLGDLGSHFGSDDPTWIGADSMNMLRTVVRMVRAAGWWVNNLDLTVLAQDIRISPHREAIQRAFATVLETKAISVKATTTDHLGFLGRGEGLAAVAVVSITI